MLAHDLAKGLRDINRAGGRPTCTIAGVAYPCVTSTLKRGTTVIVGGMEVGITLTFYVERSLFAARPNEGNGKVTYGGKTYRIVGVGEPFGASHYEIDVSDLNR